MLGHSGSPCVDFLHIFTILHERSAENFAQKVIGKFCTKSHRKILHENSAENFHIESQQQKIMPEKRYKKLIPGRIILFPSSAGTKMQKMQKIKTNPKLVFT
jgi:hypothetical protein